MAAGTEAQLVNSKDIMMRAKETAQWRWYRDTWWWVDKDSGKWTKESEWNMSAASDSDSGQQRQIQTQAQGLSASYAANPNSNAKNANETLNDGGSVRA